MTPTSLLRAATFTLVCAIPFAASANEKLKGIACRSVHLGYEAPEGTAFYNEARVIESAPGTYVMTAGWAGGYFGIQEQADGKKVVLFSLWDSAHTDDPKALAKELRTEVVSHADDVRIGRFGGEGTGGQCFLDYAWKKGETYRFIVAVRPGVGARTEYAGFFFIPETKVWKHLVTFSSPSAPKHLHGVHSFVEDFRRNRESTKLTRRAEFGPGYVRNLKGEWTPLVAAHFTGDGNPVENVDAGEGNHHFFLATGGPIENKTVKLWGRVTTPAAPGTIPADAKAALAAFEAASVTPAATPAAK